MVQILDIESINTCIKQVGFEMKWTPEILNKLYLDDFDSSGLFFWYNEILRQLQKND